MGYYSRVGTAGCRTIVFAAGLAFIGIGCKQTPEPAPSSRQDAAVENALRRTLGEPALVAQERPEATARVTLAALISEYFQNEFAAASTYENPAEVRLNCLARTQTAACRFVLVEGTVRDMGRDRRVPFLFLETDDKGLSAHARFDKEDDPDLIHVRRGQKVWVHCMVLYDKASYGPHGLSLSRCALAD